MSHYGTTAEFAEYIETRGKEIPATADDESIEAALIVASEWLDSVYGANFSGYKTDGYSQEREWPRSAAYSNTFPVYSFSTSEIPDRVVKAAYEAAFRQLSSPGSLQLDYSPNKYKSVSIDGALSVDYANFTSSSDIQAQFPVIDQLLAPLFNSNSSANVSTLTGSVKRV